MTNILRKKNIYIYRLNSKYLLFDFKKCSVFFNLKEKKQIKMYFYKDSFTHKDIHTYIIGEV